MIIDAMDICLVGTWTAIVLCPVTVILPRLASRLRSPECLSWGWEKKTPKPFIAACIQFKYLDVLEESTKEQKRGMSENEGLRLQKQRI
jgi:hypothetical protein